MQLAFAGLSDLLADALEDVLPAAAAAAAPRARDRASRRRRGRRAARPASGLGRVSRRPARARDRHPGRGRRRRPPVAGPGLRLRARLRRTPSRIRAGRAARDRARLAGGDASRGGRRGDGCAAHAPAARADVDLGRLRALPPRVSTFLSDVRSCCACTTPPADGRFSRSSSRGRCGTPGTRSQPHEPLPVPHDLRELLLARLQRLPESTRETLLLATAASQPTLELLDRALPGRARRGFKAAVEAGVVELDGSRVRFTHPLLASTHYESAPPSRQREVHRRLAEVASRSRGASTASRDSRRAARTSRSPQPSTRQCGRRVPRRGPGGGGARRAGGPADAAAEHSPAPSPAARGRPAGVRGWRPPGSRTAARGGARKRAPGGGTGGNAARAGAGVVSEELGTGTRDPPGSGRRARLRRRGFGRRSSRSSLRGRGIRAKGTSEPSQIAREAVELAEQAADDEVLAEALSTLGYLEHVRGRKVPHDLMQRAEALEAASGLGMDGPTKAYADMLSNYGLNAAAMRAARALVASAVRPATLASAVPLYRLSYAAFEAGDWDLAWELALETKEIATQSGRETLAPLGDVILAMVEAMRGDVDAGLRARSRSARGNRPRRTPFGRASGRTRAHRALVRAISGGVRAHRAVLRACARARRRPSRTGTSDAVEALRTSAAWTRRARSSSPSRKWHAGSASRWAIAAAARCQRSHRGRRPATSSRRKPASRRRWRSVRKRRILSSSGAASSPSGRSGVGTRRSGRLARR